MISVTRVTGPGIGGKNAYIDRPIQIWWIAYGPGLTVGVTHINIWQYAKS